MRTAPVVTRIAPLSTLMTPRSAFSHRARQHARHAKNMNGTPALSDSEWNELFEMIRRWEDEDAQAFTDKLHNGPNGEFWRFVDGQILSL